MNEVQRQELAASIEVARQRVDILRPALEKAEREAAAWRSQVRDAEATLAGLCEGLSTPDSV